MIFGVYVKRLRKIGNGEDEKVDRKIILTSYSTGRWNRKKDSYTGSLTVA